MFLVEHNAQAAGRQYRAAMIADGVSEQDALELEALFVANKIEQENRRISETIGLD